jgi:transcriptional regulator with XRE-family HTH domain
LGANVARHINLCYNGPTMQDRLSLGEYIRRLRKQANRSLLSLAEDTHISYSHLSRIENDSTVPNPNTVVRIAAALDGDLKLMLEMAKCLPREILNRIATREETGEPSSLRRASGQEGSKPGPLSASLAGLALPAGLTDEEVGDIMAAVSQLARLKPHTRSAVIEMIRSLEGDDDQPG